MKRNRALALLLMLAMMLSLAACGGAGKEVSAEASAPAETASFSPSFAPAEREDIATDWNSMGDRESPSYAAGGVAETDPVPGGQKLIRTAHLQMETTEFDAAAAALEKLTADLGGYYERSSISNYRSGQRWGEYTVRIPAQQYQSFLTQAGALCHVTRQETSQDDVSELYYDTEGRLKTQQIKLERLQQLLEKAEKMEDIITIESAISETEWAIEDLAGTLRHYDGKVNYATAYVTLSEVYKLSNVEEVPDSFGSRMGTAFARGLQNFLNTLEDLAVGLAYSWMWWLMLIGVILGVVTLVRNRGRKLPKLRRRKKDSQGDEQ